MTGENCPRFQFFEGKSIDNKNKLERKYTLSDMEKRDKKEKNLWGIKNKPLTKRNKRKPHNEAVRWSYLLVHK